MMICIIAEPGRHRCPDDAICSSDCSPVRVLSGSMVTIFAPRDRARMYRHRWMFEVMMFEPISGCSSPDPRFQDSCRLMLKQVTACRTCRLRNKWSVSSDAKPVEEAAIMLLPCSSSIVPA